MCDTARISPIYTFLAKVHEENFPDWRFGQFISNFSKWLGRDMYYLEDTVIYDKVNAFLTSMNLHKKFTNRKA